MLFSVGVAYQLMFLEDDFLGFLLRLVERISFSFGLAFQFIFLGVKLGESLSDGEDGHGIIFSSHSSPIEVDVVLCWCCVSIQDRKSVV